MQESSMLLSDLSPNPAGRSWSLAPNMGEPGKLFAPPRELTLRGAVFLLRHLMGDRIFLESWIFPLMERAEPEKDWYVARHHDVPAGPSLQVLVWPPGSGTRVHDHSSWGAYLCAVGSVLEERYARLDDGSRDEHACLKKLWQQMWRIEDGASTVLPYDGGIHRVRNRSNEVAISVHLYGHRVGEIDGRDYDPSRGYVCDRREP